MKAITRVVLPIAAVVGIVFGVTFVSNYSNTQRPDKPGRPRSPGAVNPDEPPLRFYTTLAYAGPPVSLEDYVHPRPPAPNSKKGKPALGEGAVAAPTFKDFAESFRRGRFQGSYEIDAPGHFDYWFQNSHPQVSKVSLRHQNCQCVGVQLGTVPPELWRDYLQRNAVAVLPVLPVPSALTAVAAAELAAKVGLQTMVESDSESRTVPAATEAYGPQIGFVRMSWSGKSVGSKTVTAELLYQVGDGSPASAMLEARSTIVPAVNIYSPGSPGSDVHFGDIAPGGAVTCDIICWSATRPELDLSLTMSESERDPCITWGPVERLTESDMSAIAAQEGNMNARKPACAYRVRVTIRERCEVDRGGKKETHRIDLGPFDKRLDVSSGSRNETTLHLVGTVRGEVRVLGDAEGVDRIDFGRPFPSGHAQSKEVRIVSDNTGLDLELAPKETTPGYLEVTLGPARDVGGRREWNLRVKVPANRLSGSLASDSAVVLQSKDASKRRIRIPVVAKTYESLPSL